MIKRIIGLFQITIFTTILLISLMAFNGIAAPSDLVGVYHFEGDATDSSGNNNDGIVNGDPIFVSGVVGKALSLDGIDDYVQIQPILGQSITVLVWAKSATTNWNDYGWIASARGPNGFILHPQFDTNTWLAYIGDMSGIGWGDHISEEPLPVNDITQWHQYGVMYDYNAQKGYMIFDGQIVSSRNIYRYRQSSPVDIWFGRDQMYTRFGNGFIDEIRVYNGVLTLDQILASYVATIVNAGPDQTVNEGDTVAFSGSFTDADQADIHTISWDFGDGSIASGTLTPTHMYADNKEYTVTLTVTDSSGGVGTDTLIVTVNNVASIVDAGQDQTINEGDIINLAATFSDPGTSDTHSATINWGDGTALEAGIVAESGGSGTVSGSHSYAKYGSYNVEVCVTDDDGASSCDSLKLTVRDITPPVITITGENPLTAVLGNTYADFGATANDNSDGTIAVTTSGTVNTASVGTYPITYTATDNSGNTATVTRTVNVIYAPPGSMCLDAPGHEILQPINREKNSVFKKGSTMPAKFRVCDSNGNSIGTTGVVSSFKLIQKTSGTVVNAVNEDVISTTPDTAFRWDQTAQQWIFNINTKSLLASYTYTYRISLNDGTSIEFSFGLR